MITAEDKKTLASLSDDANALLSNFDGDGSAYIEREFEAALSELVGAGFVEVFEEDSDEEYFLAALTAETKARFEAPEPKDEKKPTLFRFSLRKTFLSNFDGSFPLEEYKPEISEEAAEKIAAYVARPDVRADIARRNEGKAPATPRVSENATYIATLKPGLKRKEAALIVLSAFGATNEALPKAFGYPFRYRADSGILDLPNVEF